VCVCVLQVDVCTDIGKKTDKRMKIISSDIVVHVSCQWQCRVGGDVGATVTGADVC